jgi:hypothetical protein
MMKGRKFQQLVDYINSATADVANHPAFDILRLRAISNIKNGTSETVNILHAK